MKEKKTSKPTIANAIIWASMMIAFALLLKGHAQSPLMLLLLIAGWFATHGLVAGSTMSARAECAYLRRLLRRS